MPVGPRGEKRPADVIGNAVMVARIATGEAAEEFVEDGRARRQALGVKGGNARTKRLTPERRTELPGKLRRSDGGPASNPCSPRLQYSAREFGSPHHHKPIFA